METRISRRRSTSRWRQTNVGVPLNDLHVRNGLREQDRDERMRELKQNDRAPLKVRVGCKGTLIGGAGS